ncbi:MAG: hypothetical protein ABFD46_02710 [Armatimonadota bacterium]
MPDSKRLNAEYFKEPGSLIYEFAAYLAGNRIGHGTSLAFYCKEDLMQAVEKFKAGSEEKEEITSWIDTLLFDENNRIAFSFVW